MTDKAKKILSVVTANANLPPAEIIPAVSAAFPNESYGSLMGYIYRFRDSGYLSIVEGDNRIVAVEVNPSAYVALTESQTVSEDKSSTNININTITGVNGQLAIGNRGDSYQIDIGRTVIREMRSGLDEVLALADKQQINPFEREQIKKLIRQVLDETGDETPPEKNLLERFDAFMQCHSWIAAPIATAFLNALIKFAK